MLAKHNTQVSTMLFSPAKTFQIDVKDSIWNE